MARLVGIVERQRDHARVHRAKEAKDVLRGVAGEDGDAVAHATDLLEAGGDGLNAGVEFPTGDVARGALAGFAVIPLTQDGAVQVRAGSLFLGVEQFGQARQGQLRRQDDLAVLVEELGKHLGKIHGGSFTFDVVLF